MRNGSAEAAQFELKFYEALMRRLEEPARSIDIYSISACLGFYSSGMKVFSDVLKALRQTATIPGPFGVKELRILIKADDHLIDTFGVERFHLFLDEPSVLIREMDRPEDPTEWIQFAIFDGREVIYTTPQPGFRDEALGLGINQVSPAQLVDNEKEEGIVKRHKSLFDRAWERGAKFEIPRLPSIGGLTSRLEKVFPVDYSRDMSEKDYEAQLRVFLSAIFDPGLIHTQYPMGQHILDLAIGDPKRRMLAIEVKLASNDESEIKKWKGRYCQMLWMGGDQAAFS